MATGDSLTGCEGAGVAFLLDHFSAPSPLRPMDICDVNYGAAASVAGLVFTYIIVLLQFKVGDSGEPAATEATCNCICNCYNASAGEN